MTLTYTAGEGTRAAGIILCDGPECEASHTVPLTFPWRMVFTFSPDGSLVAQLDYCSTACLSAALLLQTAA